MDIIVRSGEHLLNLINNVLDMAKIESGRVALKESEVDLNQLLHEMQSLMGVGAVEKGLRFALERDPDLPRFVAVDAGKLRQVLLNLLGNAIKYTDSGGVKLRARLASIHGSEEAKVRFEVEDSGPGISPGGLRAHLLSLRAIGRPGSRASRDWIGVGHLQAIRRAHGRPDWRDQQARQGIGVLFRDSSARPSVGGGAR